jgi:hypothetical protein
MVDSGKVGRTGPPAYSNLAGGYDNPMPESTIYPPVRDYEFAYWITLTSHNCSKHIVLDIELA